jgi:hypothetical protein
VNQPVRCVRGAGRTRRPIGGHGEKVLLLHWLDYLGGAVLRNVEGLDDVQAHWTPDGKMIPLLGIVIHLTNVGWRWINGGFGGAEVSRSDDEFDPGSEVTLEEVVVAYRERAMTTEAMARSLVITQASEPASWAGGRDVGWWSFT